MIGIARIVAGVALGVETIAVFALFFDVRVLAAAILACAFLTLATGYVIFAGIDTSLRRPK